MSSLFFVSGVGAAVLAFGVGPLLGVVQDILDLRWAKENLAHQYYQLPDHTINHKIPTISTVKVINAIGGRDSLLHSGKVKSEEVIQNNDIDLNRDAKLTTTASEKIPVVQARLI
jgi:hypothetical protein